MTNCWSETRLALVSANAGRLLGDIEQALTDDRAVYSTATRLLAVISIGRIIRASLPAECSGFSRNRFAGSYCALIRARRG